MRRSNRLVALTNYFLENPYNHVKLPYFSDLYNASKSSISEDLDIIDGMFKHEEIGYLQRLSGATGGVKYIPSLSSNKSEAFVTSLCKQLEDPNRLDRKSTRLNSSHVAISYAVFCLKKKRQNKKY